MNPLLFADWGRMNRLFIRIMWALVVIMLCVVCVALAAPAPRSHASRGASTPTLHASPAADPQAAASAAASAR